MNRETWNNLKKIYKINTENGIGTKVEFITLANSVVKGKLKTITASKLTVEAGKTLVEYPSTQIAEIKVG